MVDNSHPRFEPSFSALTCAKEIAKIQCRLPDVLGDCCTAATQAKNNRKKPEGLKMTLFEFLMCWLDFNALVFLGAIKTLPGRGTETTPLGEWSYSQAT
jgi:hypothetical protein